MALKHIRFVWATPPRSGGRWRLGLFNVEPLVDPSRPLPAAGVPDYWKKYLHHTLHLSVRGIVCWGSAAALAAYFAAAAALHQRQKQANPFNRVGYLDLLLPHRWKHIDRLQGEGFILLARNYFSQGRTDEAFGLLGLGVEKNPTDFSARLDLARIYLSSRLRPQGFKLLRAGLDLGYPGRAYLDTLFHLAIEGDQADLGVQLCRLARQRFEDLPSESRPAGDENWLDRQLVKLLLADGKPEEALALVRERYPETDPFRREITVLALLESKDAAAAAPFAATWAAEQPKDPVPLRLLVRARRETGDFAGMDDALARLRELDPVKPEALLYALVQNQLAGRTAEAKAALDALLFRHGSDEKLYPTLTAALAEIRLRDALPSLERELKSRGLSPRPALMARLQADIAAGDWPAALATAETLRNTPGPALDANQTNWLETMIRLARACADAGSGNQSALVEIVADHPGALRLYRLVLGSLLAADRLDTAAAILALAEGPYPSARCIVATRADLAARRATRAVAAPAPSPSPSPSGAKTDDPLADFDALSSAVALRIENKDTEGALALFASVRRARPDWLDGAEPRLDALELPLRARSDDQVRIQLLARNTLARDAEAPTTLLALAQTLHAEGLVANAELLVHEVLRHRPAYPDALALAAGWKKPAAAPAPQNP